MNTDKPPIIVAGRDIQAAYTIMVDDIQQLAEKVATQLEKDTGESVEAQDCYRTALAFVEHRIDDWLENAVALICDDYESVNRIYLAANKRKQQDARIPHADGGLA